MPSVSGVNKLLELQTASLHQDSNKTGGKWKYFIRNPWWFERSFTNLKQKCFLTFETLFMCKISHKSSLAPTFLKVDDAEPELRPGSDGRPSGGDAAPVQTSARCCGNFDACFLFKFQFERTERRCWRPWREGGGGGGVTVAHSCGLCLPGKWLQLIQTDTHRHTVWFLFLSFFEKNKINTHKLRQTEGYSEFKQTVFSRKVLFFAVSYLFINFFLATFGK